MKYLILVLGLVASPVCAFAPGSPQNNEVPAGKLSPAAVQPAVPHHEPLIKIRYVLLPPAISADNTYDDATSKPASGKRGAGFPTMTLRLDGGTTNRVNTEITQLGRCASDSRVSC